MALELPHSIFFHIPKTGGTWVRKAVHHAGIPTNEIGNSANNLGNGLMNKPTFLALHYKFFHAPLREVHARDRFTFAFVRHPLAWYQSHWAYQMRSKWESPFEHAYASESFEVFLQKSLEQFPGRVSLMYREYTAGLDFIGRYESLVEDLIRALRMAGETFDPALLRSVPPANVSSRLSDWAQRCLYTEELRAAMAESEREAMEIFGYRAEEIPVAPPRITTQGVQAAPAGIG